MSSYTNSMTHCDFLAGLTFACRPQKIVEFGILNGHSLEAFHRGAPHADIEAYDIFEEFNGNHGIEKTLKNKFKSFEKIKINFGNFFEMSDKFENDSIDILHVDIANNGDVYQYAVEKYLCKVKTGGFMILEGGSKERDQVEWMKKYDKRPIQNYLNTLPETSYKVVGNFPSITIINC